MTPITCTTRLWAYLIGLTNQSVPCNSECINPRIYSLISLTNTSVCLPAALFWSLSGVFGHGCLLVKGYKLSSLALISRRSSGLVASILWPGTTVYGLKLGVSLHICRIVLECSPQIPILVENSYHSREFKILISFRGDGCKHIICTIHRYLCHDSECDRRLTCRSWKKPVLMVTNVLVMNLLVLHIPE